MCFEDKLIENSDFGRSRLNSKVFEKLFISYSCILFIIQCTLRSFCIKMLCFFKKTDNTRFSINQTYCLIDWNYDKKLGLNLPGSIATQLMLDQSNVIFDQFVLRSIEIRLESFLKQAFHVFFTFSNFSKSFSLSLFSPDPDSSQIFVVSFQIFLEVFFL